MDHTHVTGPNYYFIIVLKKLTDRIFFHLKLRAVSLYILQGQAIQADSAFEPTKRGIHVVQQTWCERKVKSRDERLSPWLYECVWVVRRPDEALVLQAFGDLRGGDELTAVVVVLLLAQRLSIRGGR